MKRRLLTILIFLLAGALLNVAVAWGLAMFLPLQGGHFHIGWVVPTTEPVWDLHVESRQGALHIKSTAVMYRDSGPEHHLPAWSRASKAPAEADLDSPPVNEQARGWPLLALYCWDYHHAEYENAIMLTWPNRPTRRPLPLMPIVPGFVVNTLFYAAVLWLAILGPFALRRFVRVKRGLCPKCAYPMGEAAVCTECGKTLPATMSGAAAARS
jgi:hypothetical protein